MHPKDLPLENFKQLIKGKVNSATSKNRMGIICELTEILDLYLQKKWTAKNQPSKQEVVIDALKTLLSEHNQGNIVLAQINPTPGNVEKNAKKVMNYIKIAEAIGIDAIIFTELTLMGYPIHDTIDRHPVLVRENVKWLQEIAKQTGRTQALVGFVEPRGGKRDGKAYYNAVAVLGEGKIQGIIRKSLLPTYSEFNDYRYFERSPVTGSQPAETLGIFSKDGILSSNKLNEINKHKYGVVICEDGWNDKDFFTDPMYSLDPVAEIAEQKPEIIVNCSASPTRTKKEQLKHNMLSFVAKKYKTPIVYVNQVGAMDDSSFDGSSRVYDKHGKNNF